MPWRKDKTHQTRLTQMSLQTFHNLKMSSKCLHAVSTRGELFTTIKVQCPQKRSNRFLRLKIDTGAQGNALPVRTFRQMCGDIERKKILTPIGQTTLTAYSGEEIKYLGSIKLGCKSGSSLWVNAVFYIVDVPEPVILGLPTCEALNLVTINCQLESVVTTPVYPGKFDTLKDAITTEASMAYYDVTKPITLEVDASQKGLGAALVQEKKPIAFTSKTLTKTQSNYSNVEREMLSLVHGVERFHTYLYGGPSKSQQTTNTWR